MMQIDPASMDCGGIESCEPWSQPDILGEHRSSCTSLHSERRMNERWRSRQQQVAEVLDVPVGKSPARGALAGFRTALGGFPLRVALGIALLFGIAGCGAREATGDAEPRTEEVAMPERLVFAFQKQKDPQSVREDADRVARFLSEELGIPVEVHVPASYGASVQALVSNQAQVGYLSAVPFLLARQESPMKLLLAEVRNGRTDYDSIFVVRRDTSRQTVADLKGAKMAFTSATSTSGYVMPFSRLVNDGLLEKGQEPKEFFGETRFAGGYDRALLAVLNGQADVCAVSDYTMEGPKADVYLNADQRDQLRILDRTGGVPTHLICVRGDLPASLQDRIRQALLKLSQEQPELLADVYGASEFREVDEDQHLRSAVQALQNTGLSLKGLVE
jgi:phosphonate transport system substrate-binding protein